MKETGDDEAVTATARKRVRAWQTGADMNAQNGTRTDLAKRTVKDPKD
jgi:hypothetical protein